MKSMISVNVKELTQGELLLIETLRNLEDPDELVRACSDVQSSNIKNCLLNIAAEKLKGIC